MGFQGLHRSNYTSDIMLTLSLNPHPPTPAVHHTFGSPQSAVEPSFYGADPGGLPNPPRVYDRWEPVRLLPIAGNKEEQLPNVCDHPQCRRGQIRLRISYFRSPKSNSGVHQGWTCSLGHVLHAQNVALEITMPYVCQRLQHTVRHICKHVLTTSNICKMHQKMQIWHHLCLPPIRIDNKATHKQNRSLKTQPSHENRKHPIEEKIQRTENKWQKKTTIFRDSWSPSPPPRLLDFSFVCFSVSIFILCVYFFLVHVVSFPNILGNLTKTLWKLFFSICTLECQAAHALTWLHGEL